MESLPTKELYDADHQALDIFIVKFSKNISAEMKKLEKDRKELLALYNFSLAN